MLKKKRSFSINPELRFPIAWTIFFIIVGIIIQSTQGNKFIFLDFFGKNYISWIQSFGSFVTPNYYNSINELFFAILGEFYYFFYTGGLIALLWKIISILVNKEISFGGEKPKSNLNIIKPKNKPN